MKNFTPYSSVSSSTSSSLGETYCTSKGNVFRCFAGVLSRILCSKSLPTHPSDPIEFDSTRNLQKIIIDGSGTPNLVARLMGLDSIPEICSKKTFGFIQRSKSLDSEENREKTEENREKTEEIFQGKNHRRVKTSVSFRETPEFFELEDDDFFVLNFEKKGKIKKKRSNYGNSEVGFKGHKNHRKQRRIRDEQEKERLIFSNEERLNLRISPTKVEHFLDNSKQSCNLSPLNDEIIGKNDEFNGKKARKKKKEEVFLGENKDEVEIDSEYLSPVSVLDHNTEFINDLEVTTSEEDTRLGGSESESVSRDYAPENSEINVKKTDENKEKNVGLKRRNHKKHENVEMLRKICRLAENEVKNSNWKYRRMLRSDEWEDIARDFGQGIFDQLVSELLD